MKKLERQGEDDISVIPDDLAGRLTPETLQFTLSQLELQGMIQPSTGGYAFTKSAQEILRKKPTIREEITAYGHEKVLCTHETTIEVTKEPRLTERGDCIIAVRADKACSDLSDLVKEYLKLAQPLRIEIETNGIKDEVMAFGSPALKLTDGKAMIIRKSDFIDERTVAILADKSASDLKRELAEELKNPKTVVKVRIEALQ